jgi:hypothetical protein
VLSASGGSLVRVLLHRLCEDAAVGRTTRLLGRRAGPIGLALTAWDIWRRLPPKQRKRFVALARKHGPRVAAQLVQAGKRRRAAKRP